MHAIMRASSFKYAALDDALLLHIFTSPCLGVQDKIRCEHVCRSWRELLSCCRPSSCKDIWAGAMFISFNTQHSAKLVTGSVAQNVVSIHLSSTSGQPGTNRQDACTKWILQRQHGVPYIKMYFSSKDRGWQTTKLLHALRRASSSRPVRLELDLHDGSVSGKTIQRCITARMMHRTVSCIAPKSRQ